MAALIPSRLIAALLASASLVFASATAHAQAAVAQAGHSVQVRAVDAGGRPVEGAAVVFSDSCDDRTPETTDADGVATHTHAVDVPYVSANVRAEGRVPVRVIWSIEAAGNEPPAVEVALEPGVSYGGVVVDDAGEPVEGATVVVSAMRESSPAGVGATLRVGPSYANATTDADGRWTFERAPADATNISIGAHHPGYASHYPGGNGFYPMESFESDAELRGGTYRRTLDRGRPIVGRVVDADGEPVADAKVGFGEDRVASNTVPAVTTDANGAFRLAARPGEAVTLTVLADGHAPQLEAFEMPSAEREVTIEVGPPRTLSGVVVDAAGEPVANATVFVDTWRGTRTIGARLTSDDNGVFTWDGAPADTVLVDVMAMGYADNRDISMTPGEENRVVLGTPLCVRGTVVDDETGAAIEAFDTITGIVFDGRPVIWQRGRDGGLPGVQDGNSFEKTFTHPYEAIAVRVEADGYLPADSPAWPMTAGDVTHEFRLKRGTPVTGTLLNPDGTPAAAMDVYLVPEDGQLTVYNGAVTPHDRSREIHAKADGSGRFSLPPQAGPARLLALGNAGFAEKTVAAGEVAGEVTLTPFGSIEGEVRVGDRPAGDAELSGYRADVDPADADGPVRVHWQISGTADADGRFRINRVRPGKVAIGRMVGDVDIRQPTAIETVEVEPGETATVRIGGTGRPVVGRLSTPADVAGRSGAKLRAGLSVKVDLPEQLGLPENFEAMSHDEQAAAWKAWSESDEGRAWQRAMEEAQAKMRYYPVLVDADGSLRVDDVAPGTYRLHATLQAPPIGGNGMADTLAIGDATVVVEPVDGGEQSNEPADLGVVELKPAE